MTLWTLTYLFSGWGLLELHPLIGRLKIALRQNRSIEGMRKASAQLKLIQELLESGMVPEERDWQKIQEFPPPWSQILTQSLTDLRAQGAPILPTLQRMQKTLQEQVDWVLESKVKSAQALSQAWLSLILIPTFAFTLYFFLPGVQESKGAFLILTLFSTLLSGIAFIWILSIADQARFGNLKSGNRHWWVSVQASLERVFALISSGRPPDLAWRTAVEELSHSDSSLAQAWGAQVWDPFERRSAHGTSACEELMMGLGVEIRRSIQVSLIEGRGCLDRLESIHRSFLTELKMKVHQELNLLPNRCLKPLFLLVFPSVILLLCGGLWFSMKDLGF